MNNLKLTLIVIVVIIVMITLGRGMKQKYKSVYNSTAQGLTLGQTYGKAINQSECMTGLKLKYSTCDSLDCEFSANGYIMGCMKTAKKDNFCDTVPNVKDTSESIEWVSQECYKNNLGKGKCLRYMQSFINACTEQKENRIISTSEHFTNGFSNGFNRKIDNTVKPIKKLYE